MKNIWWFCVPFSITTVFLFKAHADGIDRLGDLDYPRSSQEKQRDDEVEVRRDQPVAQPPADAPTRVVPKAAPPARGNASAASYDDRLPPVIPGETLVDGQKRKLRVWSTSGAVSAQPPALPPQPPAPSGPGNYGVILDRRPR